MEAEKCAYGKKQSRHKTKTSQRPNYNNNTFVDHFKGHSIARACAFSRGRYFPKQCRMNYPTNVILHI